MLTVTVYTFTYRGWFNPTYSLYVVTVYLIGVPFTAGLSFPLTGVFRPVFGLLSRAVEAPLVVPFAKGYVLLVFNGRFFDVGVGFDFAAGGTGEFTGLVAGLTGSGFGLFVNVADLVGAGFATLVFVVLAGVVFLGA